MKNMLKNIIFPLILVVSLLPSTIFATSRPNAKDLELKADKLKAIIGQKLQTKIDEVFASTPALLTIYNRTQNTALPTIGNLTEYQNLLNSKELKVLNHSPEMQEALKVEINEISTLILNINQQIGGITSEVNSLEKELREGNQTNISANQIKRIIYDQDAAVKGLKAGINNAMQSLNQQKQLYFTDPSFTKNVDDFTPIQKPDTLTTDTILNDLINLNQIIDTRMTSVNLDSYSVSAGDEITTQDEVWVKGLTSHAKQGQYNLIQGYKSDQVGVIIGLDFIMDNTIGLAYAFIQDHVKGHTMKDKINTHIATIYGLYELDKNLFVDAQARYGKSYINKSRYNMNLSGDISYAKTEGDLYGGKLELYYDYITQEKIHVIPSIGITYDELHISKYQEKGVGFNRGVAARKVDKTTGLLGLKLSKAIELDSYLIIPEIHVKYMNTLSSNNGNTTITILDGMEPLITPSNKLQTTLYKVGGLLKIKRSRPVNIEIGYDFGKSKKYHSHTGYISAILAF
jgi:outer membrane autotransporter protein